MSAEERVVALCNAISNLHQGDLLEAFHLDPDHDAALVRLLETSLMEVMSLGEVHVNNTEKSKRSKEEFGGRDVREWQALSRQIAMLDGLAAGSLVVSFRLAYHPSRRR